MHATTPMRTGSALVMTVGLVVLMATLATAFLASVSDLRGVANNVDLSQWTEIGLDEARMHTRRLLLQEVVDARTDVGQVYTSLRSDWYTEFQPLDNDGDTSRLREEVKHSASQLDYDDMINVPYAESLLAMMPANVNNINVLNSQRWPIEQIWNMPMEARPWSRWHYPYYLNADFETIESTGVTRPAEARYAVRYAAKILDNNGMLGLHPNWPGEAFNGDKWENPNFLQYNSWTHHHARALKSMVAALLNDSHYISGAQKFAESISVARRRWPIYDRELLMRHLDGSIGHEDVNSSAIDTAKDYRLQYEALFRRSGLQYRSYDNLLTPILPTGTYNPFQVVQGLGNSEMNPRLAHTTFMGQAPGYYRGTAANAAYHHRLDVTPATPWRVNLLTCSSLTAHAMVAGLSSQLRGITEAASGISDVRSTRDTLQVGCAIADLFGPDWPEPFPLSPDAGRWIPGFRNVRLLSYANKEYYAPWPRVGLFMGIMPNQGTQTAYNAYQPIYANQHSYLWHVYQCLDQALYQVRMAIDYQEWNQHEGSYIADLFTMTNTPHSGNLMQAVVAEFLRLMGEERIARRGDVYASVGQSLLTSHTALVGSGKNSHRGDFEGLDPLVLYSGPYGADNMRRWAAIPPHVNTRSLEYVLNDICIALFGSAIPQWHEKDSSIQGRLAVDFNGDGMAESTSTGWLCQHPIHAPNTPQTVYSFWWEGLGPVEDYDLNDPKGPFGDAAWLHIPAWYRIEARDQIYRKTDGQWININRLPGSGAIQFNSATHGSFLRESSWPSFGSLPGTINAYGPLYPPAPTGRFFIGISDTFTTLLRSELVDLQLQQALLQYNEINTYHRDPDRNGDVDDAYTAYQYRF